MRILNARKVGGRSLSQSTRTCICNSPLHQLCSMGCSEQWLGLHRGLSCRERLGLLAPLPKEPEGFGSPAACQDATRSRASRDVFLQPLHTREAMPTAAQCPVNAPRRKVHRSLVSAIQNPVVVSVPSTLSASSLPSERRALTCILLMLVLAHPFVTVLAHQDCQWVVCSSAPSLWYPSLAARVAAAECPQHMDIALHKITSSTTTL